jgi:glutaredoxin
MLQNLTVYTKPKCIFCERLKRLLKETALSYTEVELNPETEHYAADAASLVARTGHKTFPQVFSGEEFLGGFEEFRKLIVKPTYHTFNVIKRNGAAAGLSFDKIVKRINLAANYPSQLKGVNSIDLAQSIIASLYDSILTQDIDDLLVAAAANKGFDEPDYLTFAARLHVNNLHKKTLDTFSTKIKLLRGNLDSCGVPFPKIAKDFSDFVDLYAEEIDAAID